MTKAVKTKEDFKHPIFEGSVNPELLAHYVRVYSFNQRQGTVKVKTRGEVSGGGAKPWRQKGTGRARQGSRRAPHWVHGGVPHGPSPKDWSLEFNPKMRKVALQSAFTLKHENNEVFILPSLPDSVKKTKEIVNSLTSLKLTGSCLLITPNHNEVIYRSGRNIANLVIRSAQTLNVFDLLNAKNIVILEPSIEVLNARI